MKKSFLSLILALAILLGCVPVGAFAEETTTEAVTEEDPALAEPELDLAQDAQAPQTDYAFGSVSIFNGCRTLDGQVPLAGSDRKLASAQSMSGIPKHWSMPITRMPSWPPAPFPRS